MLGMKFSSPTINMFIEDENFVKLVNNPKHYFEQIPIPVTEKYIDPVNSEIEYPIIAIDDIKVCCLHYRNCSEAIQAWIKRCKRVNYDNIYIIGNSWNMHENKMYLDKIDGVTYPIVIFTDRKYNLKNEIILPNKKYFKDERGVMRPDLTAYSESKIRERNFEEIFDFVGWLNSGGSQK